MAKNEEDWTDQPSGRRVPSNLPDPSQEGASGGAAGSPDETMEFMAAAQRNQQQRNAGRSAYVPRSSASANGSNAAAGRGAASSGGQRYSGAGGSNGRAPQGGSPGAVHPANGADLSSGAQPIQPVSTGSHFKGSGTAGKKGATGAASAAGSGAYASSSGTYQPINSGSYSSASRGSTSGSTRGAASRAPEGLNTGAVSPTPIAQSTYTQSSYTANNQQAQGDGEKPKRKRNVFATVLIVIGIVLLLAAAAILGDAIIGYQEAEESYSALETYLTDDDGDGIPSVDFDALAEINPDIVGWIYIPDTEINYPVVQTTDNTTYLTKMFDDNENSNGAIFMDYEDTAPGMVDQQTTIYGHHMNDGSMFKFIDDTADQEDFDTVEVVYYITPDATYVLSPLFTTVVDETYVEARTANFTSDYLFSEYLQDMYDEASAVSDDAEERLSSTEQVLSLVTCAGDITPRTTRAVMVCAIDEIVVHE